MYQADTEILYPMRITPQLRELRGAVWENLVDRVCSSQADSPTCLAFNLMIIRLTNCLSCHTHSYRAMRGCTTCAVHTVSRFDGSDEDLVSLFQQALDDIETHLSLARSVKLEGS
jgi:hypothetical protein